MPFTTALEVRQLPDHRWQILRELVYEDAQEGELTVPEGTETDFISSPRMFRWLLPRGEAGAAPGALHDYLYQNAHWNGVRGRAADAVLRRALRDQGVGSLRAWTTWATVRLMHPSLDWSMVLVWLIFVLNLPFTLAGLVNGGLRAVFWAAEWLVALIRGDEAPPFVL